MMMEAQEEVMGYKDHTQIIKGKRTKRQRLPSPLRLTMATTSSSGGGGEGSSTGGVRIYDYSGGLERAVASPTTSVEFAESTEEEEDMANCLILLAQGHSRKVSSSEPVATTNNSDKAAAAAGSHAFQCKTCDRCFPSFQALGGHRASHKKLKANIEEKKLVLVVDEEDDHRFNSTTSTTLSLQTANRVQCNSNNNKAKVHECSICGTEFSSGQALGGHMRRHRTFISPTATTMSVGASSPDQSLEAKKQRNNIVQLDLNLPAPEDDQRADSKFSFMSKGRVLVFSASSLVDCHY